MAQIHRISGSTKYLINGTCHIRGKKFETLQEIQQFYDHHEQILADTKDEITRQQDQLIKDLTNEEVRLDCQLQEAIARQTREVDNTIHELNLKSTLEPGFLTVPGTGCGTGLHWPCEILISIVRAPGFPIIYTMSVAGKTIPSIQNIPSFNRNVTTSNARTSS